MATTLTMVVTDGRQRRARARRRLARLPVPRGELRQITKDHTYVQHLVDTGQLTPAARATHPWRNVVLRSVDGDPQGGGLDVVRLDVAVGDRLLLASDGLTDLVSDSVIADVLGAEEGDEAAATLTHLALDAGGRDNITVVVVDLVEGPQVVGDGKAARRAGEPVERGRPGDGAPAGVPQRLTVAHPGTLRAVTDIQRPALEGTVAVRDGRRLSFAEYGSPRGAAIVWMHGTPGARRQIPLEARRYADEHGLRIIGVDRPGIGSSTPYLYGRIGDWTGDLELLLDALAIDTCRLIGLSGGGPYVLAAGANLPERVHGVGVLGGVAPTRGPDAVDGGAIQLAVRLAPLLQVARVPLGVALTQAIRLVKPLAGTALDLYAAVQPPGDKNLLSRPEFKAMFLDDLLNGSRFQTSAPLNDLLLFTRDWGFTAADVTVPVRWWHGDEDHIVPFRHGQHLVARLPDATLTTIDGESHLGGLGIAEEVISTLMELGPRRARQPRRTQPGP